MNELEKKIGILIIDKDTKTASVIRSVIENVEHVTKTIVYDRADTAMELFDKDEVHALLINIFSLGISNGIDFISQIRERHNEIGICLLGSSSELLTFPNVPDNWKNRFGHYFLLHKDQPIKELTDEAEIQVRRLRRYWLSRTAKAGLQDLKQRFVNVENNQSFSPEESKKIAELMTVAESALDTTNKNADFVPSIVPGFESQDIQELVKDTLSKASNSLHHTANVNNGVLIFGAFMVLASFIVATFTLQWEAVAFGGFGVAGVIATLITNPLKAIGIGARRLVQIQVAYLGFLNQISILSHCKNNDSETILNHSKHLGEASKNLLEALEKHFN